MLPFDRMEARDAAKLTSVEALKRFQQYGFLWIRLPQQPQSLTAGNAEDVLSVLQEIYKDHPESLERKWSVENVGTYNQESDLSPAVVLAGGSNGNMMGRYYVSTILSRRIDKESLEKLLRTGLKPYFDNTEGDATAMIPPQLGDSQHKGGAWLFLGRNCDTATPAPTASTITTTEPATKKQKFKSSSPLIGRAEHVDDVLHAGTWHVQLSGSKTWFLRPNPESDDWRDDNAPPDLRQYLGKEKDQANCPQQHVVKVEQSKGGQMRLCCRVEEGDLFVLNTKAWYHRTELPVDTQRRWSISIARDFNLPVPPLYCPKDFVEGDVILEENEIPEQVPTAKGSEEDGPNCALAEVSLEEEGEDDNDDTDDQEEAETTIVLVALRDVKKGEPLMLQQGEDDSEDEEENAPESVDPRVIAKQFWNEGETVLSGEEIPEDLPLSLDANCRLGKENGVLTIQSLRPIAEGEIFAIAPDEEDLEDYEQVEVALGSGEMKRNNGVVGR